jgi:hypothetical protein
MSQQRPKQLDSPLLPKIFKCAGKAHVWVYRDTGGKIGADRRAVRAMTAGPDERARLWPKLVELYADFDNYRRWTDREIPVVVLRPR